METPFFGPAYVSRSTNQADNQIYNLVPEIVEDKNGKNVGAFYGAPGLTLFATCGSGPIWGMRSVTNPAGAQFGSVLYVVSGSDVYQVGLDAAVTHVGTLPQPNTSGTVSMIDNGTQLAMFTSAGGYIVPGGSPLTSGSVATGGSQYTIGDTIVLSRTNGLQSATASITVSSTGSGGAVTGFTVANGGAFQTTLPTGFTQLSTTGSGAGFTMSSPIYGANVPIYTIALPFTLLPNAPVISAAQQDGFALINQPDSYLFWQSNELDFSTWNPLAFASASGDSDNIVAMRQTHLELFIIKQSHTEIWFNAGTSPMAFQRLTGQYIEVGCAAVASPAKLGETLCWLSQNSQGAPVVIQLNGYTPNRISTHDLEWAISQYSTFSDAIGYSYQQDGHSFYVLVFPSGNETWCYDATTSGLAGVPMWHKRAAFSGGVFNRHWSNAYTFFAGKRLVGDYRNGNIYFLDTSALTDNGTQRKWLRSWRALPKPTLDPVRFSKLQVDMQTGIGVPDGTNPKCMLRWSDDGGHNWSNEMIEPVGPPGATAKRVMFNRLGSTRRNSGLDRIFELSSADQFPVALIRAELQ